ncbi:hypothetical protein PACTADRAFT_50140 [Pachysolen tannophilus NRRL Y-2460]|uniref:Zn(2)-C6 fungal-type domain-containing protein n=1 Tax=Pachysolen tannophilus NRRL Y-2460 TaxID=669874 RepID=A0A1E4TUG3_PACTA|nr:hypothetical protein PACTADRAFT_50140 [Pachysolen tannophilus NRRL Y-2460]
MGEVETSKRKRLRVPVSCQTCRKKKIKCDKLRPSCGGCIKSHCQCQYEERTWSSGTSIHGNVLNFGTALSFDSNPKIRKMETNNSSNSGNIINNQKDNSNSQLPNFFGPPLASFKNPHVLDGQQQTPQLSNFVKADIKGNTNGFNKELLAYNNNKSLATDQDSKDISSMNEQLQFFKDKVRQIETSIALHDLSRSTAANDASEDRASLMAKIDLKPDDTIDFFGGYNSLQVNESRIFTHGALSWITLVKKDTYIKVSWMKALVTNKNSLMLQKDDEVDDKDDKDADDEMNSSLANAQNKGEKIHPRNHLGFSTVFIPDSEQGTIEMIKKCLPSEKAIWLYVDRFFEYIHPLMPYLDYKCFTNQLIKIIGPKVLKDSKVENIGIRKRLDFALMGILLLVLRFSYLTLLSNTGKDYKTNDEKISYLLSQPVSIDASTAAQFCLNQFRLLRKSNLLIFQCALYMRLYHRYAPEDGDGSDGDSQIYNGMLLQMAVSIGLHRDPSNFPLIARNRRACNLRRKIWYGLLLFDRYQSFVLGNPSYTKIESYDTQMPAFDPNNINAINANIEKLIIDDFKTRFQITDIINDINSLVFDLKVKPKVSELVISLVKLEGQLSKKFGDFSNILHSLPKETLNEKIIKVSSMAQYWEAKSYLQAIYHHLFMKYEAQNDTQLSNFYLEKAVENSNEIYQSFPKILTRFNEYVGLGFDLFLTCSLLLSTHRILQLQFSLFTRYQHLRTYYISKEIYDSNLNSTLTQFCSIISKKLRNYLNELNKITPNYYYAWKMLKAQTAIYSILENDSNLNMFEVNPSDGKIIIKGDYKKVIKFVPQTNIFADFTMEQLISTFPFSAPASSSKSNVVQKKVTPTGGTSDSLSPSLSHNSSGSASVTGKENSLSAQHPSVDLIWVEMMNNKNLLNGGDINDNINISDTMNNGINNKGNLSEILDYIETAPTAGRLPDNNNNNSNDNNAAKVVQIQQLLNDDSSPTTYTVDSLNPSNSQVIHRNNSTADINNIFDDFDQLFNDASYFSY